MAVKRKPIVVTVCIDDYCSDRITQNAWRLDLAKDVTRRIEAREWKNLDAVLFPGGFLRSARHVRPHSHDVRVARIAKLGLVAKLSACARLLRASPGVNIVVGIDGPKYQNGDSGDQLCVAVNVGGVAGIASKIFPVGRAEGGGLPESKRLVLEHADFGDTHRLVKLANGERALLCACYDMFGVAERNPTPGARGKAIRRIAKGKAEIRNPSELREAKSECLSMWHALLKREDPSVALAAIHGFYGHSTAYWQKHGIASASAALDKGYALGAAHFLRGLPKHTTASTLAAQGVAKAHLKKGIDRTQNAWRPSDSISFESQGVSVLARLFDANVP